MAVQKKVQWNRLFENILSEITFEISPEERARKIKRLAIICRDRFGSSDEIRLAYLRMMTGLNIASANDLGDSELIAVIRVLETNTFADWINEANEERQKLLLERKIARRKKKVVEDGQH